MGPTACVRTRFFPASPKRIPREGKFAIRDAQSVDLDQRTNSDVVRSSRKQVLSVLIGGTLLRTLALARDSHLALRRRRDGGEIRIEKSEDEQSSSEEET
jgi:hypothetical protein